MCVHLSTIREEKVQATLREVEFQVHFRIRAVESCREHAKSGLVHPSTGAGRLNRQQIWPGGHNLDQPDQNRAGTLAAACEKVQMQVPKHRWPRRAACARRGESRVVELQTGGQRGSSDR